MLLLLLGKMNFTSSPTIATSINVIVTFHKTLINELVHRKQLLHDIVTIDKFVS